MADWTKSMTQTYEFYRVDPATWEDDEVVETILSCTINRDSTTDTLGSATIDCTEVLDECYIRVYLKIIQNGITERFPLGTFLVQTPSVSFDGKVKTITMDGYTPLIELKGVRPPLGYTILKKAGDTKTQIMPTVSAICRENMRAPVVESDFTKTLRDDFVADLNDNWMTYLQSLASMAEYEISLDEMSRVIFQPQRLLGAMKPVWTYDDGNSSILHADIKEERDLYSVPNVVEVIYSTPSSYLYSKVVNKSKDSPISTVNRGRQVVYRDTSPSFAGEPTQEILDAYAKNLLKNLSSLERKVTYKHGYCPVRLGDCVVLDYLRAGLENVRARVISQSISCTTGCVVEETAVYTENLWDGGE